MTNGMLESNRKTDPHMNSLQQSAIQAEQERLQKALAKKMVRDVARKNGWHVFTREIDFSRSYPKGAREGLPISRTSYSRWGKIVNFRSFADEFAVRVGL